MDKIFTKSKRTFEELNNKTVELRIQSSSINVHGVGKFKILKNDDGLLVVDIDVDNKMQITGFTRYHITQDDVQKIEDHPDQSIAQFRLFQ